MPRRPSRLYTLVYCIGWFLKSVRHMRTTSRLRLQLFSLIPVALATRPNPAEPFPTPVIRHRRRRHPMPIFRRHSRVGRRFQDGRNLVFSGLEKPVQAIGICFKKPEKPYKYQSIGALVSRMDISYLRLNIPTTATCRKSFHFTVT